MRRRVLDAPARRAPASAPSRAAVRRFSTLLAAGVGHRAGGAASGGRRRPAPDNGMALGAVVACRCRGDRLRRRLGRARRTPSARAFLVADGLGHGLRRRPRAGEAVRIFRERPRSSPSTCSALLHAALRSTRGAAVGDRANRRRPPRGFASPASATSLRPFSTGDGSPQHGLAQWHVGLAVRKTQEFVYPWSRRALLVMHSDGLATHWKLDALPGPVAPGTRPWSRPCSTATSTSGRDDATVWSLRLTGVLSHDHAAAPILRRSRVEHDVVLARQRARQRRRAPGLRRAGPDPHRHRRVGGCRNAFQYAGGGRVEFATRRQRVRQPCSSACSDRGPGIRTFRRSSTAPTCRPRGIGDRPRRARDGSCDRFADRVARRGRAPSWRSASCCPGGPPPSPRSPAEPGRRLAARAPGGPGDGVAAVRTRNSCGRWPTLARAPGGDRSR